MTAQDNLNPQQFYHGSMHKFSGEVKPGTLLGHLGEGDPDPDDRAFFTTDKETASWYARSEKGKTGYLYTVQPTGPYERDPYEQKAFGSAHPLKITNREEISTDPSGIADSTMAKLKYAFGG